MKGTSLSTTTTLYKIKTKHQLLTREIIALFNLISGSEAVDGVLQQR